MVIPQLIASLKDNHSDVRSATVYALAKLADHGESVVACYSYIANADMKSSFARKLGRPFRGSLRC
jgi:HEAT repeat protein